MSQDRRSERNTLGGSFSARESQDQYNLSINKPENDTDPTQDELSNRVTLEDAFERVGGFGKFQKVSAVMNMLANAGASFLLYAFAFLELEPKFMCQLDYPSPEYTYATDERTLEAEFCSSETNYHCAINWDDPTSIHNIIEQLDMYCAPKYQIGMIGFVFLLGIVIGCLTVVKLADVHGRKPVCMIGLLFNLIVVVVLVLSTNKFLDFLMLFVLGLTLTMRYYVGYTFNVEMQPKSHQVLASTMQFLAESLVYLFICYYFSHISKYWITLQVPNLILTLIGLFYVGNMPETPRFLVATGQYEKARATFSIIADWNGIPKHTAESFVFITAQGVETQESSVQQVEEPKQPTVSDITKTRVLKRNLYGSMLLWAMAAFNFYLLTFFMKYFKGNIFENSVFFAMSDLFAFFLAGVTLKYLTVPKALCISFTTAAIGGAAYLVLSSVTSLVPFLICLSRLGTTMTYNIGYVSVNRLFPTKYVATVYGVTNLVAHLFACLAPLVAEVSEPLPFIVYLIVISVQTVASLFLEEIDQDNFESTQGLESYDENCDGEADGKKRSIQEALLDEQRDPLLAHQN